MKLHQKSKYNQKDIVFMKIFCANCIVFKDTSSNSDSKYISRVLKKLLKKKLKVHNFQFIYAENGTVPNSNLFSLECLFVNTGVI